MLYFHIVDCGLEVSNPLSAHWVSDFPCKKSCVLMLNILWASLNKKGSYYKFEKIINYLG